MQIQDLRIFVLFKCGLYIHFSLFRTLLFHSKLTNSSQTNTHSLILYITPSLTSHSLSFSNIISLSISLSHTHTRTSIRIRTHTHLHTIPLSHRGRWPVFKGNNYHLSWGINIITSCLFSFCLYIFLFSFSLCFSTSFRFSLHSNFCSHYFFPVFHYFFLLSSRFFFLLYFLLKRIQFHLLLISYWYRFLRKSINGPYHFDR